MRYPESAYSRREFLDAYIGAVGACLAGFAAYPLVRYVLPWREEKEPDSMLMPEVPDIGIWESMTFAYGPSPCLLIRTDSKEKDREFRAFNATCTHFACVVHYLKDKEIIHCACHDGNYDLEGRVISGPPPRPLKQYQVAVTDKGLLITQPGLLEEVLKKNAATA